ncbi:NADH-ubiquinone reductase (H(+)-translocating) NDE2 NDAI_0E01660 [Naumovozyma dairenensis CBS 421]|uniref:NADH:ubiquinone reductase (non-electrogenic) n=1 Tax=Naumovozyma dairenensis (strain ATCC 10597 / BCRC 20456 / CBS 421 / NBRC 0211 / NRRL Y-12639) TaxID=1071378 RepID=G0WB62_NAUDC|nr:hypothetical protein NDAI_0E01660 [Naumovozyma dairenensis CBS 421]CCD24982.1 hypothetical protein NDAI_0E01660 [Naumovozyma dairenensis CBS 421]
MLSSNLVRGAIWNSTLRSSIVAKRSLTISTKLLQVHPIPPPPPPSAFSSSVKDSPPVIKQTLMNRFGKLTLKVSLYGILAATLFTGYSLYSETLPTRNQLPQSATFSDGSPRKTIVILGSGWGSISLLKNLDTTKYNVIVVSPRNYFLFTPLLPSTPMRTIELKSIIEPVRSITRRSKGEVTYYEAKATSINPRDKSVKIESSSQKGTDKFEVDLKYDYLVVSVGAKSTTFNIPGVIEHANFLKEIEDSEKIRLKIINNIEMASFLLPDDPERKKLLNFVVVGGGPTGVEFAAELQDYVRQDLKKWLPDISKEVKVTLVEALPNILNMFDKSLIEHTEKFLKKEKINLKLKTMVKSVDDDNINAMVNDKVEKIPYGVLIWATGNAPSDLCKGLMEQVEEQTSPRGLLINNQLQLLGFEDSIFALGDCTFHPGLFPTAQVAHQEGDYLADRFKTMYKIDQLKWKINHLDDVKNHSKKIRLSDKLTKLESKLQDFEYLHRGTLSYIGNEKAIVELKIGNSNYKISGPLAIWFWKSAYLNMCFSVRNRASVAFDWFKVYFFGRDSSV